MVFQDRKVLAVCGNPADSFLQNRPQGIKQMLGDDAMARFVWMDPVILIVLGFATHAF